jgi:hypothetical protein
VGQLLALGLDGHEAPRQVDVPAPQTEQLAPPQPPVRGEEHQRPIPGVDGVRQLDDLGDGGNHALRRSLGAGTTDRARVDGDEPVLDGGVQDRPHSR